MQIFEVKWPFLKGFNRSIFQIIKRRFPCTRWLMNEDCGCKTQFECIPEGRSCCCKVNQCPLGQIGPAVWPNLATLVSCEAFRGELEVVRTTKLDNRTKHSNVVTTKTENSLVSDINWYSYLTFLVACVGLSWSDCRMCNSPTSLDEQHVRPWSLMCAAESHMTHRTVSSCR